jgi:hypothetical protein
MKKTMLWFAYGDGPENAQMGKWKMENANKYKRLSDF